MSKPLFAGRSAGKVLAVFVSAIFSGVTSAGEFLSCMPTYRGMVDWFPIPTELSQHEKPVKLIEDSGTEILKDITIQMLPPEEDGRPILELTMTVPDSKDVLGEKVETKVFQFKELNKKFAGWDIWGAGYSNPIEGTTTTYMYRNPVNREEFRMISQGMTISPNRIPESILVMECY